MLPLISFIFYKTYIPQITANRKSINALKNDIINELELLNFLDLIIHEYTNIDAHTHMIKKKKNCFPLYFIVTENENTSVTRFSLELSTEDALDNLVDPTHKNMLKLFFYIT